MKKVRRYWFPLFCAFLLASCSDEASDSCVPMCDGKSCGPDGCGGACGLCEKGTICDASQCVPLYVCEADCDGKSCGSDGCGGSCGVCGAREVCGVDYQCHERDVACVPDCAGRECGSDGCDGVCGYCEGGEVCGSRFTCECVPRCDGRECGSDGCGGMCGNCAENSECNASTGLCMEYRVKGQIVIETQTVYYDNENLPQFDKKVDEPASNIPITLYSQSGIALAEGETDENGNFDFALTRLPYATDWLSIVPVYRTVGADGKYEPKFAIFEAVTSGTVKETYDLWQWTIRLSNYGKNGDYGDLGKIRITIAQNSGGIFIYTLLKRAYDDLASSSFGKKMSSLPSIGVFWKPGLVFSCGTCFMNTMPIGAEVGGVGMKKTMQVSGALNEESAWGYPTLLHEFGHYVLYQMRDNSNGGAHYLNQASDPKLAWSEGFATLWALVEMSRMAEAPVTQYWRVMRSSSGASTSYWIDYAKLYSSLPSGTILPPKPDMSKGMLQDIPEAWVTHLLWALFDGAEVEDIKPDKDGVALGEAGIYEGIKSDRYKNCGSYNLNSRTATGADFVDFVDAVVCHAMEQGKVEEAEAIMDLVIEKSFPYDRTPTCSK